MRVVNLETSITRSDAFEPKGINYRMSPENGPCLSVAGLDCCVLANNHVLDWGPAGLIDTLNALDRLRIKTAGAGHNLAEANAPAIVEIPNEGRVIVVAWASETALSRSLILLVNTTAHSRTALRKINHLGPSTSARNPPKNGLFLASVTMPFRLIVGNENGGEAGAVVNVAQPLAQVLADLGIEGAEGLVDQQHARLNGERPGERDSLALAARQLRRITVPKSWRAGTPIHDRLAARAIAVEAGRELRGGRPYAAESGVEHSDRRADSLVCNAVIDHLALAPRLDKAFESQPRQLLRHGRLADLKGRLQFAHRFFAIQKPAKN